MANKTSKVAESDKNSVEIGQFFNGISDVDIRLLKIFNVVVAAGGLSAASDELNADLSTVSRYIKDLEDKVGTRLCNRGRSGFSLTANGAVVHKAAHALFLAIQAFQDNVDNLHADPVGRLRLGVMDALISDSQFRLSDALRKYKLKAPRVQVQLSSAKPNDIERAILTGGLDLGIVVSREKMVGLHYHLLYMETSGLYCAEQHPLFSDSGGKVDEGDLCDLAMIEDPYTDSLPVHGLFRSLRKAAMADSIEAIAMLIRTGDYVGFLPNHYAKAISTFAPLRQIRPDLFSYEQGIELVYRSGRLSPLVRDLLPEMGIVIKRS